MIDVTFREYLVAYLAEALEIESSGIDPDADLAELGLDSLRTLEMACTLMAERAITLDIARFRDCRTVNEIVSTFGGGFDV